MTRKNPTPPLMPCSEVNDGKEGALHSTSFAYIGVPKSAQEFITYIQSYNFGSLLPSYVVIHNTANPDASWAPLNSDPDIKWDRNEVGLSEDAIRTKRKHQLDDIRDYYVSLGWESGPHLFIDEKWIWLFTPMYEVGTHAKAGNSFIDANGTLHYSIGVETVGYFGQTGWPAAMQHLLQVAIQGLRDRLKTFTITYTAAPANRPDLHDHQISFHRDYNKPECPGSVITPAYAIPILQAPPVISRVRALGVPVYQQQTCTGPLWGHLANGEVVELDATYSGKRAHLKDGRGFIWLDDSVEVL